MVDHTSVFDLDIFGDDMRAVGSVDSDVSESSMNDETSSGQGERDVETGHSRSGRVMVTDFDALDDMLDDFDFVEGPDNVDDLLRRPDVPVAQASNDEPDEANGDVDGTRETIVDRGSRMDASRNLDALMAMGWAWDRGAPPAQLKRFPRSLVEYARAFVSEEFNQTDAIAGVMVALTTLDIEAFRDLTDAQRAAAEMARVALFGEAGDDGSDDGEEEAVDEATGDGMSVALLREALRLLRLQGSVLDAISLAVTYDLTHDDERQVLTSSPLLDESVVNLALRLRTDGGRLAERVDGLTRRVMARH